MISAEGKRMNFSEMSHHLVVEHWFLFSKKEIYEFKLYNSWIKNVADR